MRLLAKVWVIPPTIIVGILTWQWRNFQLDDSLIYLRYVRNFLSGQGLVYNPGELFNGLTSPLHTLTLTLAASALGHPQVATLGLSAAGLLAAALLGGRLFATNDFEASLVASLVASSGYFYTTFGMETTILLALVAATLHLARKDSAWVFPMVALATTARAEAAFLAIPVGVLYLYRTRRLPAVRYLLLAAAIFVAPFAFNWAYYGHVFPGTAAAKFGQGASGYWGGPYDFLQVGFLLDWAFSGSIVTVIFLGVMSAIGVAALRKDMIARVSWVYLALLATFYLVANMPNYPWYYAPFFYLLCLYAGTGIGRALTMAAQRLRQRRIAWAVVALVVAVGSVFSLMNIVDVFAQPRHEDYTRIGKWLNLHTPRNASVAAVEIGALGWYSERPIIDILGLVNDYNAEYVAKRDLYSWLYHYQPDYVLCHQPLWTFEPSCALLAQSGYYVPAAGFKEGQYVLLARKPGVTDEQVAEAVKTLRPR